VRDRGRCAFIGSGGRRCDERRFIEFHHLDPKALGGEASVDNIELRCRRHNDYEGGCGSASARDPVNLFQNKFACVSRTRAGEVPVQRLQRKPFGLTDRSLRRERTQ
jgi:hypothetical protein